MANNRGQMKRRLAVVILALAAFGLAACNPDPTAACGNTAPAAPEPGENPVVVVGGTLAPYLSQIPLVERLDSDGWTTSSFTLEGYSLAGLDINGLKPIEESAACLDAYVDEVLAQYPAGTKVSLIGHSQGALVSRYYINELGGDALTDTYISLAGPNYGTDIATLGDFVTGGDCLGLPVCAQMGADSGSFTNDFLAALNDGPDVAGGVDSYSFYSENGDNIVWQLDPIFQSAEAAAALDVGTNRSVGDECFGRYVSHLGMIYDGVVYEMVTDALSGDPVDVSAVKCLLSPVLGLPI